MVSTHSRAEAAAIIEVTHFLDKEFQHTAARRRLPGKVVFDIEISIVSTHSRAEAAAVKEEAIRETKAVSTHSRAEAAASD